MEELKELREDEETTLDVVLSREHGCTKQLLEAEQNYDFEGLCRKAFDGIERVLIPLAEPEE